MLIENVLVLTPDHGFEKGLVEIDGDKIAGVCLPDNPVLPLKSRGPILDGQGGFLVPGLIDTHFHGIRGRDFMEGTRGAFDHIAREQAKCGTTSICPATMTMPLSDIKKVLRQAARYESPEDGAAFEGVYLEGPFISPKKCGAQDPANIQSPDPALITELYELSKGRIKVIALAPEAPGAIEAINRFKDRISFALAHSAADFDKTNAALAAGLSRLTHTFNAMPSMLHRAPGPIAAAALDDKCLAELICDGYHVHPAMVKLAFRLFKKRIILISDSMMAAGMPDGQYELGGQDVFVKDKKAVLKDGTLAGSASTLLECVSTLINKMGIDPARAFYQASAVPAKAIGIFGKTGSIEAGKRADLLLLSPGYALSEVILRGRILPRA